MIKAKKLQKSYGPLFVLTDVSFSLGRGQKVALVGHNGTGKTTLLKILAGIEELDAGTLEIDQDVHVGYLPQDTSLSGDETISAYLRRVVGVDVLEEEIKKLSDQLCDPIKAKLYDEIQEKYVRLDGYVFNHRIEVMLSGFGIQDVGLQRKLSDLSSGQKSKVVLAGILLKGVDLLLLDEPTNNLDLPSLIWLEDFLKKTNATCIIVSHDRQFLDRVVKKIFEINWHTRVLTVTNGVYSDYLAMKVKQIARQKEEHRLQQEEITRLNNQAREKKLDSERGAHWIGSDNDRVLRGFKRDRAGRSGRVAKAIEKRVEHMGKIDKPVERDLFEIPLEAEIDHGKPSIILTDVVAGYSKTFFRIGPMSFEIRYGERVGFMGLNGTGKSTLLKTITGYLPNLEGKIEIGSGIRIGNMMQEHEMLPRDLTPFCFLKERTNLDQEHVYAKLQRFCFNEKQIKSLICTLSPGERARLLLALFSSQSVNMLILDEPTNHLDLEALEALEEVLKTYKGTVLLVSHDRCFIENTLLDKMYVLSDGILSEISDYNAYVRSAEEKARKLIKLL